MQRGVGLVQGDAFRAVELDVVRQPGRREVENATQCHLTGARSLYEAQGPRERSISVTDLGC